MRLVKDNSPGLREAGSNLKSDFKEAASLLAHDAGKVATAGARGVMRFAESKKVHMIVGAIALVVGGVIGFFLRKKK